jgi:DNA-binding transcriptional LysR family regulator
MKTLNLQKLLHALIVAQEHSLLAASKKLHITQSALTRSIQSLEDELSIKIFRRKSTGIELTAEGQIIINKASELLSQAGELYADARALSSGARSVLLFGMDPVTADIFLTDTLMDVVKHSNLMQVQVKVESRSTLMSLLQDHSIDFFVADITDFSNIDMRDIHLTQLRQIRGSFYVRQGHPLSNNTKVPLQQIYEYPILTPTNVHESTWESLRWNSIDDEAWQRKRQIVCPNIQSLKEITRRTNAIFATADLNVSTEFETGEFLRIDHQVANHGDLRTLGILSLKASNLSIHSQQVMTDIIEKIRGNNS